MMNVANRPFELTNIYYDLLYRDKPYQQEANYISNLLQYYSPNAHQILELGSGTGNYSTYLSLLGYTITGIERDEEMNKIARSKLIPNFTPITNNIVSFELQLTCDAVVALFHVISYLTTNNELISCFKQVAKHLKPGGIFIFDVWYTPAVYTQVLQPRIKQVDNQTFFITRKAYPTINYVNNTVQVDYDISINNPKKDTFFTMKESHTMRHFSTCEIELVAAAGNFKLLAAQEFLTAKEPGKDTWGVCYILKKEDE